jgi:hypothetical protein
VRARSGYAKADLSTAQARSGFNRVRPWKRRIRSERSSAGLLDAGLHFGPRPSWNPKMKKYIFGVASPSLISKTLDA